MASGACDSSRHHRKTERVSLNSLQSFGVCIFFCFGGWLVPGTFGEVKKTGRFQRRNVKVHHQYFASLPCRVLNKQ